MGSALRKRFRPYHGLRYRFGRRKEQPDIVALDAGAAIGTQYTGGIEVKIRSNFNVNIGGS